MKQRLSLLEVCKLPDVKLHSKQALFKALVNKESDEAMDMKEHIIKLSYTVKTIGVQGNEVGITSKRVPLKFKKKQEEPHPQFVPAKEYLPHQSFYSKALIPVRGQKEEKMKNQDVSGLQILSARKPIFIDSDTGYGGQQFKIRTKSMAQLRTASKILNRNQDENYTDFGRVKNRESIGIGISLKKKSYSNLLKECKIGRDQEQQLNPLMHEQNPMFKKIKKIKEIYPDLCQEDFIRYQRPNTKNSSAGNLKFYREQL